MALVSDDLLARSGFGAVRLQPDDVVTPVRAGIDTFLAAFATVESQPTRPPAARV